MPIFSQYNSRVINYDHKVLYKFDHRFIFLPQELASPGKVKFLDEVTSIEEEAKRLKGKHFESSLHR